MSEMEKDLQSIYTAWGEAPPFDRPLIPFFRKKLAELGYVKVDDKLRRFINATTDQLKRADVAETEAVNIMDYDAQSEAYEARRMAEWMQIRLANEVIRICSAGERVVAKDATGEEGESNGEAQTMSPMP